MDEFGILVESIGFRANGKSAPMAKLKPKPKSPFTTRNSASDDSLSLPVDELDGIFRSRVNISKVNPSQNLFGADDIFGGPVSNSHHYGEVDLESVFSSSNNQMNGSGSLSSRNSVGSVSYDDLLGSMGSKPKQGDDVDDLFGGFGGNFKQEKRGAEIDDLMPGFGGVNPSKANAYSNANGHSSSTVTDDPFLVFESHAPQSGSSWPFESLSGNDTGKGSVQSSMEDSDDFVMGGSSRGSKIQGSQTKSNKPCLNGFDSTYYVDEIFGGGNHAHPNNATRQPSSVAKSSTFDDLFFKEKRDRVKRTPSEPSFGIKKSPSATNIGTDFTSLFGDVTTASGEFLEIDGEPADRREIRLRNHIMKNERMAAALAAKNQRDLQQQREQEEKQRLGETLDNEIKRWAAGKEGNLRALLSSLHLILGPESGWRPVGLTDMITSNSVRKVYKKANLYVHPDKVQQRGASIQQQYIAEKVFDLLKEASTKFSAEEMR